MTDADKIAADKIAADKADKAAADKAAADKAAADKIAADKADAKAARDSKVAKTDSGEVIRDFTDYPTALAQADAIGNSHVEPIGVAFHVAPHKD